VASKTAGNVQDGDGTREEIRQGQHGVAQEQEGYQQQAEEVKQGLQQANELGREAVGRYVRAFTSGYEAFITQPVMDPRQTIDFATEFVVQTAELQRSFLNEVISVGQVNAQAATRAAEAVSDG
jgi:hypothetical protein